MRYPNIHRAAFVERPNRFVARCLLRGEPITVHVKNTGRCRELLANGDDDYLKHDKIAVLGEIDCQPTIHFMNLVWASSNNGLQDLYFVN